MNIASIRWLIEMVNNRPGKKTLPDVQGGQKMRKLTLAALLAGTAAFAWISPANAIVSLTVLDGITPVPLACVSTVGSETCTGSNADFSVISATVTGSPNIPAPDLGLIDLDVESAVGGTHTLTITGSQSGISRSEEH